jgi:hypothetical protein
MANVRTLQRSFAGGEVTPEFFGRIDEVKYQTGAATMRNFIALPHGPVANRPGTRFVRAVKDSTKRTRVIPFTFSTTQTFAIELGAGYFRFHTQGATLGPGTPAAYSGVTAYAVGDMVTNAGTVYYCFFAPPAPGNAPPNTSFWYPLPASIYEIPNPYAEADLFDIHFVQSADVLTLVHPNYQPRELRRLGATKWVLSTISFVPDIGTPTGVAATATTGSGSTTYKYKVGAVTENGLNESLPSAEATVTNNLLSSGHKNTITWSAVTGAFRYNVYKEDNGLFGYIGQTDGLSFVDANIAADLGKTPPNVSNPFSGTGDYPGAVSYFEQRRAFAGTTNKPQNIWMTKSGTESNLSFSLPTRDDDSINFRIAAREANTIRHIVPLSDMILLTSSAEWRITSQNTDAITPTSINVKPQSYIGANNAQPAIINNTLLYAAARGGHIRELGYSDKFAGYVTGDLSLRAPHLFDGLDIVDIAYAKAPQPVVWFVSSNGKLLGLTYVPDQQVSAWHQHDTDGVFESICVVAEGTEDALYCVVKRTVDGNTVRYVERMADRLFGDQENAYFVDCGLTYDGAPSDTLSGLAHLEGKTVSILVDGAVHPRRVVTSGEVSLDVEGSVVHIGLPITSDLGTLPLAMGIDNAFGQGRYKNINKVYLRVYRSSGIFVGPTVDELVEAKQRTIEDYGVPPALKSEEIEVVTRNAWDDSGQIFVRQVDPLPLTVVSMTMEVAIGG